MRRKSGFELCKKNNGPESLGAVARTRLRSLAPLEVQLQRALQDAWIARTADLVEVCIAQGKRRAADRVQVIKSVERFESELPAEALSELQVLEHSQVRPPEARKPPGSRSFGRGCRLTRQWARKSCGIEPAFKALRLVRVRIPHLVGAKLTWRGPQAVRPRRVD